MKVDPPSATSPELLRAVLDSVPLPVFWKDRASRYLGCNAAFAEDAGVASPEALVGKTDHELAWREFSEAYQADDRAVMSAGVPRLEFEESHRSAGAMGPGVRRTSKVPLRGADGEVFGVLGIYADISEQRACEAQLRRAEDAMREQDRQFRVVFESSPDANWVLDEESRFVLANPAAARLLGFDAPEGLHGLHPWDISPDAQSDGRPSREKAVEAIARARAEGIHRFEWTHRTRDGVDVLVEITLAAFEIGGAARIFCIGRDLSAWRQAQREQERLRAQLAATQRMESVGRLAGGVAHDFNNMLNVILGRAAIAMDELGADAPARADLQEIVEAAEHAAGLTRQLLAFAQRQPATPAEIDVNARVEATLRILRRLIGEDVSLSWSPGAKLAGVKMDPSQLDQVLTNLCVNARDAIAGVGHIWIETRDVTLGETGAEAVRLSVRDDGCGIPADVLPHVFEPFFTTKGVGRGSGLGLATVYGIVKQNGGQVAVRSEPGRGATFEVDLPAHRAAARDAPAGDGATPRARGSETVLLVEDEPIVMRLAHRSLARLGYTVLSALSGAEALRVAAASEGAIDALVTDVIMPGMSGWDLSRRLLELRPETKVLFVSGYTADAITGRAVLAPGVQFLQKPYTPSLLAARLRDLLDGRGG